MDLGVDGHADEVGTNKDNMILSEKRANSVEKYLLGKGIARDKIQTKGFGEDGLKLRGAVLRIE